VKSKKKTEPRVQASMWLPRDLMKRLKLAAVDQGITMTAIARQALEEFLSSRRAA